MKFEIGEKVRLKHVTDKDKQQTGLSYLKGFEQYEGLTATIDIASRHSRENTYLVIIDSQPRKMKFYYAEAWLEKLITYDAF